MRVLSSLKHSAAPHFLNLINYTAAHFLPLQVHSALTAAMSNFAESSDVQLLSWPNKKKMQNCAKSSQVMATASLLSPILEKSMN